MDGSVILARWSQCVPKSNTYFLWPTQVHIPNDILIGSAVFAQLTAESPYTLQWAALFPSKLPLHGGSEPPSNMWFLGPPHIHNPFGIVMGSAIFAGLTIVIDTYQQADRPCFVSDIVIFVLKRDVELQLTRQTMLMCNNRLHLLTLYCNVA